MTHDDLKQRASEAASRAFGDSWSADSWAIAPGRIELIGNHIDYNGGPVLAAAIDRVVVVGTGNMDNPRQIGLAAADTSRTIDPFEPMSLGDWHASEKDRGPIVYVKGIVAALQAREIPIRSGVGLAIAGNVPRGFGMSSSAALCIATILALTIDDIDPLEMVAIAREAEHRAGAMVGAMDQSASVAGNVILFDGRDNSFSPITPNLGDFVFAVADSHVDRSLRVSSYSARVRESEEARKQIAQVYDLHLPNLAALADAWTDVAPTLEQEIDPILAKRARHVATETRRVRQAVEALESSDWTTFGTLMNESGESSAVDYEISQPDVEQLVRLLRGQDGVLGARMMGGGEGGPALALLHKDAIEDVSGALHRDFYQFRAPRNGGAAFQVCSFGPGAHRA